ncbi:hypothetical protein U1Q18_002765, partial [Sarracenia purpurea var. burkii]
QGQVETDNAVEQIVGPIMGPIEEIVEDSSDKDKEPPVDSNRSSSQNAPPDKKSNASKRNKK